MSLQLDSLVKSIDVLERSIKTANRVDDSDEDLQETVRAGVIHSFEIAYEISWKMIKRWLKENIGATYVDGVTRRELFRRAAENRLIIDVDRWMEHHDVRNLASHTYDEQTAQSVFERAVEFAHDVKQLLMALEARND